MITKEKDLSYGRGDTLFSKGVEVIGKESRIGRATPPTPTALVSSPPLLVPVPPLPTKSPDI